MSRVHLVTLGCPKNQVDAEVMLGVLARAGHQLVLDPDEADVLVVNTCAFIGPAKEESIDAVLDAARAKAGRPGRRLVVTGCLAQRYADDLRAGMPEVDAFVGTGDLTRIAEAVEAAPAGAPVVYRGAQHELPLHGLSPRVRTGAWWSAYLKVSEGCDHTCSFCIIPKIRGRHESRPLDDVLAEATALVADGAVELNLIAQDLTAYGRDRRDGATLAALLRALGERVPGVRWLRLLYAYPASITDELLEVMATEPTVTRYLDVPFQHVSDGVLLAMRRERSGDAIRTLVRRVRDAVPGIALRSSFIVGFPGETERDVDELCGFLEEFALAHVGVFRYSREENTHAATLPGQLPEKVKRARFERVMATQAAVAARTARAQVGRVLEVLVEGDHEQGWLVGRTSQQAPEIDGLIRVRGEAAPGDLVRARVTGADTYDLVGEITPPNVDTTWPAPYTPPPGGGHLTMRKAFLKKARETLDSMREQLLRNVRQDMSDTRDASKDEGMDTYDLASDARDREIDLILGDRDRDKLAAIDDALARVDEGSYGICESCESEIAEARLVALPFTRLCVNCQAEREREVKLNRRYEEDRSFRRLGSGETEDEGSS